LFKSPIFSQGTTFGIAGVITVSHGRAYTVVRAMQQVNGKGQFWVSEPMN